MNLHYVAPPTVARFAQSGALVRCLIGPLGSGKTMGCLMELLRRSVEQKPNAQRVRQTRMGIIRNTLPQLRSTVMKDIETYVGPMVSFFTTESALQFRLPLPDGTTVHSDWLLLPLDRPEDQQRLLSLQLTGAFLNEVREIPFDILAPLLGRIGRYPPKAEDFGSPGGPSWFGLIADSNPWSRASSYHKAFVLNPQPGWQLFHQPSGLSPDAENVTNLPPGYYQSLLASAPTDDWAKVHVESMFGDDLSGQAVYAKSFNPDVHVTPPLAEGQMGGRIEVNPRRPLMITLDFGRTPTALVNQMSAEGRLLVLKELTSDGMGVVTFVRDKLGPELAKPEYMGARIFIVADPAGEHADQVVDSSPYEALQQAGYLVYPAPTNDLSPRLVASERLMRETRGGKSALLIDRQGCPQLVLALGSEYKYRRRKDNTLEDIPEKKHPWSDLADCLQYASLGANGDYASKAIAAMTPRVRSRAFDARAWT